MSTAQNPLAPDDETLTPEEQARHAFIDTLLSDDIGTLVDNDTDFRLLRLGANMVFQSLPPVHRAVLQCVMEDADADPNTSPGMLVSAMISSYCAAILQSREDILAKSMPKPTGLQH